jgi:hypothetical protein
MVRGMVISHDSLRRFRDWFSHQHNIENHIRSLATSKGNFTYTFLNPVCFMDNITPDFFGKVFGSIWLRNGDSTPLQLVGTKDIGRVAAEALIHSSEPAFKNKNISIAGDSLTPIEAQRIFKEETGEDLPQTFSLVGLAIRGLVKELGTMFAWFKSDGYAVDIPQLRERFPFVKDFRAWLREESAWKK